MNSAGAQVTPEVARQVAPERLRFIGGRDRWVMLGLIAVMSLVFAVAMFRGLEFHSGYQGSAYQAIHPGSFPQDPFMAPSRPTMQSLYYPLVRIVGPLWLDDRVTIAVFALIAFVSLIGIDRTVRLLGGVSLSERIAMLSLMLLEHRILSNHALPIDNYEFNPTTFAAPVIIWLLYASLARQSLGTVMALMILAPLVSVKNAWLPVGMAALLLWKDRLGRRGKALAIIALLVLGAVAAGGYYLFLRPTDGTHVTLFNYLLHVMDNHEANPWMDPWWSNLLFVALCVAGLRVRGESSDVRRRVRLVAGLSVVVWLVGGVYLSWAPDALKVPHLVPFDVTRALWWSQYVIFLALGVALLKRLQAARSWGAVATTWALLMGLYLAHSEARLKLAVLVVMLTGLLLLTRGLQQRVRLVAVAMCFGTVSLYAVGTLHHRLPALAHLVQFGVMGDNPSSQWVGVNEYLREQTPADALVLALSTWSAQGRTAPLHYDGSLRTRAGRSMPLGHHAAFYFDDERLRWTDERVHTIEALVRAWDARAAADVLRHLATLGAPDYLVIPNTHAQWLRQVPDVPYRTATVIHEHTIFRRNVNP